MYDKNIIAKLYSRSATIRIRQIIVSMNERNLILVVQVMCLNDGYGILLTINHAMSIMSGMRIALYLPRSRLSIVSAIDATAPAAAGALAGKIEQEWNTI